MEEGAAKSLLATSILGTLRIFVVILAGFLASKWPKHEPLLTEEARRCASRLCTLLFLPALVISSTGATLNRAVLRDSWQLVVASSFTILVSNFTAWAFARALLGPEDRITYRPVQLAIAFQNPAAFPLLLVASLCQQDDMKSDTGGDAAECLTKATGMIFIYVAVWQVWFYAWGFDSLAHDDTLELSLAGRSSINSLSLPTTEIAAPESTADLLAQGQCVAGNTRRQVTATDCGGSTANGFRGGGCWKACKLRVWDIFVSPNIIAVACGLVIAVVPPVQEMLFVNPRAFLRPLGAAFQTIGTPEVAVSTLVMAGSLAQVPATGVAAGIGAGSERVPRNWRRYRLVVALLFWGAASSWFPLRGLSFFWLAKAGSSVTGETRLMHLIVLIEFGMPSASLVIVVLNQVRMTATAGFLSRLLVWQYGAVMFTVSVWTTLAVRMLYRDAQLQRGEANGGGVNLSPGSGRGLLKIILPLLEVNICIIASTVVVVHANGNRCNSGVLTSSLTGAEI